VVLRDESGRVLVVRKRGTHRYMLPGGKIEAGESAAQTAVRELREEVGAQLDIARLVSLGEWTAPAANEPDHLVHGHVFEHPIVTGLGPRAEIEDMQWLAPAEMGGRDDLAPLLVTRVLPVLLAGPEPSSLGTMSTSDPVPVDPVADALRMRASDADREKVAAILRDAYAEGRLTRDEYDERLTACFSAATYGDLVPVLAHLPVPPGTIAIPTPASAPDAKGTTTPVLSFGSSTSSDTAGIAIFGAMSRKGAWVVPEQFNATCIFGGGELDFTEAQLTSRETVINGVCLFGGLEITVPEGIAIRNEAVGIFGGVELPPVIPLPADAPVLIIKGAAIFGGIEVKRPKPPKTRR
jgi:8-oxo-dGTP pyrophosphatase MutT (NUDIX family)